MEFDRKNRFMQQYCRRFTSATMLNHVRIIIPTPWDHIPRYTFLLGLLDPEN
jgi:hypothetical protein